MNPYAAEPTPQVREATDLFGSYRLVPAAKKQTERGALLEYFASKIHRPIGYVAMRCAKLQLVDLYFMKSSADGYEREGKGPWAKAWYGMLKNP